MQVVGHRGARWRALENTVEALRIAYEDGADGVEFDVQISADGEPVLFHDDDLAPMAGSPGRVADWPWRVLRQLEVTDRQGHRGSIAHLDVALELLLQRGGLRNLELKVVGNAGPRLVDRVVRALAPCAVEGWVVSSFDRDALERFAAVGLGIEVASLVEPEPCDYLALAGDGPRADAFLDRIRAPLGPTWRAIHPNHGQVTEARAARWRAASLSIRPWTVNAPNDWTRLRDAGIDAAITDDPGGLRRFLDRRSPGV